jgi:hypothetical protein
VAEPKRRLVELYDPLATNSADESSQSDAALPEFRYPVRELFDVLKRP